MNIMSLKKLVAPQLVQLESRDVPATFYVDPSLGAAVDGSTQTFNAGQSNQVTNLIYGASAATAGAKLFSKLDIALQAAGNSAGADTIMLANGTITIDNSATGSLQVTDKISLMGSGKSVTTLVPAANTSTEQFGVMEAIGANFELNASNLTFDGAGKQVGSAFYIDSGKGVFDNVTVKNTSFGSVFGVGITSAPDAFVNVLRSEFSNYGRIGVSYVDSDGWVVQSTFTGRGPGAGVNIGVQVIGESFVEMHFNTLTNHQATDGTFESVGVWLYEDLGKAPGAMIKNNTFGTNTIGVLVGASKGADGSTATITRNNFAGTNEFAVGARNNTLVNAQRNYWSDKRGPYDPDVADNTLNAGTNGARVSTQVDYGNWLRRPWQQGEKVGAVAAGSAAGGTGAASLFNVAGTQMITVAAFSGYTGDVRVAAGDVNGDGTPDLIRAFGSGIGSRIQAFNGLTGAMIYNFDAYGTFTPFGGYTSFSGGVYVASGDVDGDGFDDIVTGAGPGFSPIVKAFSGKTGEKIREFVAFKDWNPFYAGGVTVGTGDMNNDGNVDIVTGTATQYSLVNVYDSFYNPSTNSGIYQSFFAFDPSVRGVNVALGDLNGDNRAEVIVGYPQENGTAVFGWKANFDGTQGDKTVIFSVTNAPNLTGVRVTARDLDDDGATELIFGYANEFGVDNKYRIVNGKAAGATYFPPPITTSADLFGATTGIFVG
jgi:hypothetical protein